MNTKRGASYFSIIPGWSSGNGNEIYNIYNCGSQRMDAFTWTRPLNDGQANRMPTKASPTLLKDGLVQCLLGLARHPRLLQTNHDLSYIEKSRT